MSKIDDLLKLTKLLDLEPSSNSKQDSSNEVNICSHLIGKFVIIRTYAAGVHVGYLKEFDAKNLCVRLEKSRRIWMWKGAFTLSEIANNGIKDGKLCEFVDEIIVTQVCEILPTSTNSENQLNKFPVYIP